MFVRLLFLLDLWCIVWGVGGGFGRQVVIGYFFWGGDVCIVLLLVWAFSDVKTHNFGYNNDNNSDTQCTFTFQLAISYTMALKAFTSLYVMRL